MHGPSRAHQDKHVELFALVMSSMSPCYSTSSTQPKCMGSTRRTCRVETCGAKWNFGLCEPEDYTHLETLAVQQHVLTARHFQHVAARNRRLKVAHTDRARTSHTTQLPRRHLKRLMRTVVHAVCAKTFGTQHSLLFSPSIIVIIIIILNL